jgi:hypothetical protein
MNNLVKEKIKEIQFNCDELIYNTISVTLDYYYEYIQKKYNESISRIFLSKFSGKQRITYQSIENFWYETCAENLYSFTEDIEKYDNKVGVYFIFNKENQIIYIGRSENVGKRAIQSFINKLPYGSDSISIYDISSEVVSNKLPFSCYIEAIAIDYFLPILNQKKENIGNLDRRVYAQYVYIIQMTLKELKKYRPSFVTLEQLVDYEY